MLTKRTNILFSEEQWQKLLFNSKEKKVSVGKLIRNAVDEVYLSEKELKKRRRAIEDIERIRPKPFKGTIDYKELINAGRKY